MNNKLKILDVKDRGDYYLVMGFNPQELVTSKIPKNSISKELEQELINFNKI